jgi:hypothetical protein
MSPQKQTAQISNSAASTGPRTEIGKLQSSQNRVVHGLCSKKFKIAPNDRPEFERHYNELLAELAPVGAVESQLAEAIVIDLWRMSSRAAPRKRNLLPRRRKCQRHLLRRR